MLDFKSHWINTQFNAKSDCKDMGNQNDVFRSLIMKIKSF